MMELEEQYEKGKISGREHRKESLRLQIMMAETNGFGKFYSQYEYLKSLQDRNISGSFLNQYHMEELFFNSSSHYIQGIVFIILALAAFSGMFSLKTRHGLMKLIKTTKKGNSSFFWYKIGISAVGGSILMVCSAAAGYFNYFTKFKVEDWNAPIQSITEFQSN